MSDEGLWSNTKLEPERDLQRVRQTLIEYLKAKVEQQDWHGVSDAANDLRVLEKEIEVRGK